MEVDATPEQAMHYARSGDLSTEVASLARPLVERGKTPGIVVGVLLPDGSMHFFGYGVTDPKSAIRPGGDTLFATGSLSKGFLGVVTALQVHQGALSWNDTLGQLLPPSVPLSSDAKKITLIQLATHTSGLPNQPMNFQTCDYFIQYLFTGKNFYRHLSRDYVFHYLAHFKAPQRPDVHYSNLGYALMGYVLEQRTGVSVDDLVEREIARPLGLKNTGYRPETLPGFSTRAHGFAGDEPKFVSRGKPVPDWQFTDFMKGTGGIYSSARDLLTFAAAALHPEDTPLGAAFADTLRVRAPRTQEAPAVAWFVDDLDGQRITYQIGVVGGFTSYLGLDVERQTAVVVLQNSFNWTNTVGHKLLVRLSRAQTGSPSSPTFVRAKPSPTENESPPAVRSE